MEYQHKKTQELKQMARGRSRITRRRIKPHGETDIPDTFDLSDGRRTLPPLVPDPNVNLKDQYHWQRYADEQGSSLRVIGKQWQIQGA